MTMTKCEQARSTLAAFATLCLLTALSAFVVILAKPAGALSATNGPITRSEVIARAETWVPQWASIPYDFTGSTTYPGPYGQNYRPDCSGFVSMAWHLSPAGLSTVDLLDVVTPISKADLKPGDALGILGPGTGGASGHVMLFRGWTDSSKTSFNVYEHGSAYTPFGSTYSWPYSDSRGTFMPYRYDNIIEASAPNPRPTPGLARFGGTTWDFYMTNTASGTGVTDQIVSWSGTLAGDVPLVGDWNGDGKSSPGLARYSGSTYTWTFYLTNITNGTGITDQIVTWAGTYPSDVPTAGDWDGDGVDSPGLVRFAGSDRTWYLTNVANGTGITDFLVTWGGQLWNDSVVVGDWNGDGRDSPGIARLSGYDRTWYLTNVSNGVGGTDYLVAWAGQLWNDTVLVGDWNG